jgi:hypothetical protein
VQQQTYFWLAELKAYIFQKINANASDIYALDNKWFHVGKALLEMSERGQYSLFCIRKLNTK